VTATVQPLVWTHAWTLVSFSLLVWALSTMVSWKTN